MHFHNFDVVVRSKHTSDLLYEAHEQIDRDTHIRRIEDRHDFACFGQCRFLGGIEASRAGHIGCTMLGREGCMICRCLGYGKLDHDVCCFKYSFRRIANHDANRADARQITYIPVQQGRIRQFRRCGDSHALSLMRQLNQQPAHAPTSAHNSYLHQPNSLANMPVTVCLSAFQLARKLVHTLNSSEAFLAGGKTEDQIPA